jgi:hypothetical protein
MSNEKANWYLYSAAIFQIIFDCLLSKGHKKAQISSTRRFFVPQTCIHKKLLELTGAAAANGTSHMLSPFIWQGEFTRTWRDHTPQYLQQKEKALLAKRFLTAIPLKDAWPVSRPTNTIRHRQLCKN